jgi:hypothetical protein
VFLRHDGVGTRQRTPNGTRTNGSSCRRCRTWEGARADREALGGPVAGDPEACVPDFGGGFSLKRTLPALVPGLSYSDLKVQGGEVATVELQRLMLQGD